MPTAKQKGPVLADPEPGDEELTQAQKKYLDKCRRGEAAGELCDLDADGTPSDAFLWDEFGDDRPQ
ncbi:MAG TPA: hypothetical protein VIF61_00340 [Methylocystis sp.]|jgi:hypothetical protein